MPFADVFRGGKGFYIDSGQYSKIEITTLRKSKGLTDSTEHFCFYNLRHP
jgi:hypothetical protein